MTGAKGLLGLAAAAAVAGAALALSPPADSDGRANRTAPAGNARVLFTSLPAGAASPPGRLPAGSRILVADLAGGGAPRPFLEGFAASGSPSVSHDGRTVLFSGREREEDRDGIFEVASSGGRARRVAASAGGDCGTPALLPDGGVVFAAPAPGFRGRSGAPVRALFVLPPGGEAPVRITFHAAGEDGDPFVMGDGRILFRHSSGGKAPLLTVHGDGTGIEALHGAGSPGVARSRPREGSDGTIWFVEGRTGEEGTGRTRIVRLDPRRPSRAAVDALPGLEGVAAAAEPLPGGGLLVSLRAAAGRPTLGLRLFREGGAAEGVVIHDDPDRDETDPVLLAPRRRPQGHLSLVDAASDRGTIFCIDARRTGGPVPGGPSAAAVRLHESLPPDERGLLDDAEERLLGTVPLAADGSFFAAVPADRPLRVEALDAEGAVVAGSGASFWVRPGETRGCIGCHEDPSVAPPNVFPAAVLSDPADLARPDRAWRGR